MEQIAQATPGPKWFQIYMPEDAGKAKELLQRAHAAGFLAVVLTIDSVGGAETQAGRRTTFPAIPIGNFPGETSDARPAFKSNIGWDDVTSFRKPRAPGDFEGSAVAGDGHAGGGAWLRGDTSFEPRRAVARRCAGHDYGAAAHRGSGPRQIPIVVDGGIRRGQDVFKALALGANAVALGRPPAPTHPPTPPPPFLTPPPPCPPPLLHPSSPSPPPSLSPLLLPSPFALPLPLLPSRSTPPVPFTERLSPPALSSAPLTLL